MTASTREKPTEAAAPEAKGGKKKLMIILLVIVLAAGGAAYFFLFSGSKATAPQPGVVLDVAPIAVNLAGGGYLKVGVAMQLTADVSEKDQPETAKATDLIISTFSGAAPADVTGARDALKASLQAKLIKAYGKDVVMGIYYTDYVTQ